MPQYAERRGGFPTNQVQSDFFLEFYKAHRAHEIALNNATATYEQSLLRLILVFNAASAGAFLVFIEKGSIFNFFLAIFALFVWIVGVSFGFLANYFAYLSQREFTRAYRYRRQAEETRRVDRMEPFWAERLGTAADSTPQSLTSKATCARKTAEKWQKCAIKLGMPAVIMAILGLAIAVWSVAAQPTPVGTSCVSGEINLASLRSFRFCWGPAPERKGR